MHTRKEYVSNEGLRVSVLLRHDQSLPFLPSFLVDARQSDDAIRLDVDPSHRSVPRDDPVILATDASDETARPIHWIPPDRPLELLRCDDSTRLESWLNPSSIVPCIGVVPSYVPLTSSDDDTKDPGSPHRHGDLSDPKSTYFDVVEVEPLRIGQGGSGGGGGDDVLLLRPSPACPWRVRRGPH